MAEYGGAKGWLDWLPQETLLFHSSALHRKTRIDLAADAGCLSVETIALGRAAMGERVTSLVLQDRREVWRLLPLLTPLPKTPWGRCAMFWMSRALWVRRRVGMAG